METNLKRPGCVSAWLWVALIVNFANYVYNVVMLFSVVANQDSMLRGMFLLGALTSTIMVLGTLMLLQWNKYGFYAFVIATLTMVVAQLSFFHTSNGFMTAIISLVSVGIWWLILQKKVDDSNASYWRLLTGGWIFDHHKVIYGVTGFLFVLALVLSLIAVSRDKTPGARDAASISEELRYEVEPIAVEEDSVIFATDDSVLIAPAEEEPARPAEVAPSPSVEPAPTPVTPAPQPKTKSQLEKEIDASQANLPMDLGGGMKMTRIFIEGDYVVFYTTCDENLISIDAFNSSIQNVKQTMVASLNTPDTRELVRLTLSDKKGMTYRYVGRQSGKVANVRFPYRELKNIYENPSSAATTATESPSAGLTDSNASLKEQSKQLLHTFTSQVKLPIDCGGGLMNTQIYMTSSYLVYVYECDESQIDMDVLASNKSAMKAQILGSLSDNSDSGIGYIKKLCKQSEIGTSYIYRGKTSKKSVKIDIPLNELPD